MVLGSRRVRGSLTAMGSGFVGIVSLDVRLPGRSTLKDRRSALAPIRRGLRDRFGASVAEVGSLDTPWQAQLTAALVEPTQDACDERLAALERWLDERDVAVTVAQVRTVTPEDLA